MHRIDGPGATVNNLFTEGNPSLGIPATTVTDDWLNDVQEELATVIENADITLSKGTQDQLYDAIVEIFNRGGGTELQQTIANNQGSPANITGLSFDKTSVKTAHVKFDIFRRTDSSHVIETGDLFIVHNTETDLWEIQWASHHDDSGVIFSITSAGQVQYTSDNISGANYTGTIRLTNVVKFRQSLT